MLGEFLRPEFKNEDELATYLSYRKFETDLQSNLATSYDNGFAEEFAEGFAEGLDEGRAEEEALKIARKMLLSGFPMEQIIALTDVNPEDLT